MTHEAVAIQSSCLNQWRVLSMFVMDLSVQSPHWYFTGWYGSSRFKCLLDERDYVERHVLHWLTREHLVWSLS